MDPDAITSTARVPHGSSDDPALLDFSANVNPETPAGVRSVYEDALDIAHSYPPRAYPEFRAAAGRSVACDPEGIVPTAGGLGAIRLTIETTVSRGDSILVPAPSFGEYAREVRLQGASPAFVPHDELFAADPGPHALAIACNPNNPTGAAYSPDELRDFADTCRAAETSLLVDEAFLGYTDSPTLAGASGVVVARSLTKLYGLPGLRAGYAVATGDLLDRLATAVPPWTLGVPAAAVGTHCLKDTGFVEQTKQRVRAERSRLRDRLSETFDVHPSDAPFLLVDVGTDPSPVIDRAREAGIAIRDATTFRGLESHVRVAVRTAEANDRLVEALDA